MDVHHEGAYSAPLLPGMVITVEPGVYLSDEEIGLRIEDDVLVTDTECEILSGGLPRDADAVEAAMSVPPPGTGSRRKIENRLQHGNGGGWCHTTTSSIR